MSFYSSQSSQILDILINKGEKAYKCEILKKEEKKTKLFSLN